MAAQMTIVTNQPIKPSKCGFTVVFRFLISFLFQSQTNYTRLQIGQCIEEFFVRSGLFQLLQNSFIRNRGIHTCSLGWV